MTDNSNTPEQEVDEIFMLYIDPKTQTLSAVKFPMFGFDWTKPSGKFKLKDKKIQQAYAEAMVTLHDLGGSCAQLYEILENAFGMAPEKKVVWTKDDVLAMFRAINDSNCTACIKNVQLNDPELFKVISLAFEEGAEIIHKTSGWSQEQLGLITILLNKKFNLDKSSYEEKSHYDSFMTLRNDVLSQVQSK